jgi:monoamine oxidase
LQAESSARGAILFSPAIPEKISAVHQLGFGAVIKVLLAFKTAFWREKDFEKIVGVNLQKLGFLFSEVLIPTWWTQFPSTAPLLSGWLAGPKAAQLKDESDEMIFQKAIDSLSAIFQMSGSELKEKLAASYIGNWMADPFTRGAYAYTTVESAEAIKILKRPVEETIYFAGEALHEGSAMGMVEAALESGMDMAKKILIA